MSMWTIRRRASIFRVRLLDCDPASATNQRQPPPRSNRRREKGEREFFAKHHQLPSLSANHVHGTSSHPMRPDHARVRTFGGGGPNAAAKYATTTNAISSQKETRRRPAAPLRT